MDTKLQKEFREDLRKSYLRKAFECFSSYAFHVKESEDILGVNNKDTDRIDAIETESRGIEALEDRHTVENRGKLKTLKNEADMLKGRIASRRPAMERLDQEIKRLRDLGDRNIRLADFTMTFEMKEPAKTINA